MESEKGKKMKGITMKDGFGKKVKMSREIVNNLLM